MKLYENLVEIRFNSKTIILVISLLLNVFHVFNAQKILPLTSCTSYLHQCHFPSTRCNRYMKSCECEKKYPIPLNHLNLCLDYRQLGQECVASEQCSQTENSVCVTSVGKQIDSADEKLVDLYFQLSRGYITGIPDKENVFGHCKCKKGYRQMVSLPLIRTGICRRISFNKLTCSGAHECQEADLNSHCDKDSKRCYCDSGYVFDNDKNECTVITRKYGDTCKMDFECHTWDENMECSESHNNVCICKTGYVRNPDIHSSGRCKPSLVKSLIPSDSELHLCKNGFRWDGQSGECEREWRNYGMNRGSFGFISVDKLLETMVIVIFCCVTIAFLRFWRYILPQNIYESQTGMFSDFSQTNRVSRRSNRRNSRSNSLSRRGRVIQFRVNIDSPETQSLSNEAFVELPLELPVSASHSSLPTYESASVTVQVSDTHPPPYNDEPPTYEEAMSLFQTSKFK